MLDVIRLLQCNQMIEFPFETILHELGFVAKFFRFVFNEIGVLSTKHLINHYISRQSASSINDSETNQYTYRINYLLVLLIISKLLLCTNDNRKKYDAGKFTATGYDISSQISLRTPDSFQNPQIIPDGNSLWLQELEYAFLDFTLKQYHSDLYKVIRNATSVSFEICVFYYKVHILTVFILDFPQS